MSKAHALIIDDNVKNVSVLAHLLSDESVTHTQVTNTNQIDGAVASLSQVDVVFLDLEMPGLNGYEVLAKLKGELGFEQVPVVAYTVHVSEINNAHQYGFDGFIGKPINPDKFPGQLARILRGESVWEIQ